MRHVPSAFQLLPLCLVFFDLVLGPMQGRKVRVVESECECVLQCGNLAVRSTQADQRCAYRSSVSINTRTPSVGRTKRRVVSELFAVLDHDDPQRVNRQ